MFVAMNGLDAVGVVSLASFLFTNQIPAAGTLSGAPVALAGTPDNNKLYSVNSNGTVDVIDARNFIVTKTLAVGGTPVHATISADGGFVYVVNSAGEVNVIQTSDDTLRPSIAVGANPTFAFFDPRLQRLYVTNQGGNSVSVINADRNTAGFLSVLATVPVGTAPKFVTALPDGSKAYVSNSGSNTVSVISTLSNTVLRTIPTEVEDPNPPHAIISAGIGHAPENIVSSTDSTKVAVLNKASRLNGRYTVTSIRTTDDQVVQTIELPQNVPNSNPGVALTPTYMISQQ
jgi:YVTN family beta-propeller protein